MDAQLIELVKTLMGPGLAGGGVVGLCLLYRKFEQERAASLREDYKNARDERDKLREELRKSEEDNDKLRAKIRGDEA